MANSENDRVEIFSETGEFISQLGVEQLFHPWGIAIHGDSVYISCSGDHTVSKLSLTEMRHVSRIGGEGTNNVQFDGHITTDFIRCVFIVNTENDRICIHDPNLNHLRNITHQSMSGPYDVKVSRNCMYVLCPHSNPCMYVINLEGDMLYSFITCGE